MRNADLEKADVSVAQFGGADLRSVDLGKAVMTGADLSETDMRGAFLRRAGARKAEARKPEHEGQHCPRRKCHRQSIPLVSGPNQLGSDPIYSRLEGLVSDTNFLRRFSVGEIKIVGVEDLCPEEVLRRFRLP